MPLDNMQFIDNSVRFYRAYLNFVIYTGWIPLQSRNVEKYVVVFSKVIKFLNFFFIF